MSAASSSPTIRPARGTTAWRVGYSTWLFATAALCVLGPDSGVAADHPIAPQLPHVPLFDWSGFYVGGHFGYTRGRAEVALADPTRGEFSQRLGSLYGGVQAGYNHVLPSRVLLGLEADFTFPNYLAADDVAWSRTTDRSNVAEKVDYIGTLRGRLGYGFQHWMIYATGGLAFSQGRFLQNPGIADEIDKVLRPHIGLAWGSGAEFAIAPHWALRLEFLHRNLGPVDLTFPSGTHIVSGFDSNTLRVGLNYQFGRTDAASTTDKSVRTEFPSWEVHGQTTYIQQAYPRFRSPYLGENSLTPWPQTRNTWTVGAYLGTRLWEGGELYYNPELLQGFGLHNTTGAAGFPNGEAQKSNFAYPHYNTSRLFLRQTWGLGGEQEKLEGGPNQLSSNVDISRVTVQVGKFAVPDVFDGNAYAKDTRKDFMNWSIWAAGAFDYAADRVGLTYGAVAELNQKHWAVRAGYFLTPSESNGDNFDTHVIQRGNYVVELENRYSLFSRPGKLRSIAWLNSTFAGSFRETLDNPLLDLDITQTRRGRTKYGYAFNVEQSLTEEVGLFARWSWNDGKYETIAFTDINSSFSFGASIKGKYWGRPDDTIGIGAAVNALSRDYRDFLAAGGLGVLIGDGRLNYREETILETYYSMALHKALALTFDYQFLANPAYNADRGPVSIFSARVHAEF